MWYDRCLGSGQLALPHYGFEPSVWQSLIISQTSRCLACAGRSRLSIGSPFAELPRQRLPRHDEVEPFCVSTWAVRLVASCLAEMLVAGSTTSTNPSLRLSGVSFPTKAGHHLGTGAWVELGVSCTSEASGRGECTTRVAKRRQLPSGALALALTVEAGATHNLELTQPLEQ